MSRIFIIHCWEGAPGLLWYQWLKTSLEKNGNTVRVPAMPDPNCPKMDAWISTLAQEVGQVQSTDLFIGHSIGCQTIGRYLLSQPETALGILFVAGWTKLRNLTEDYQKIADPWLEPMLDLKALEARAHHNHVILSDDDEWVEPAYHKDAFSTELKATVDLLPNRGHFDTEENDKELKEILPVLAQWGVI